MSHFIRKCSFSLKSFFVLLLFCFVLERNSGFCGLEYSTGTWGLRVSPRSQVWGTHLWALEGINSRPPLVRENQAACLWPERIASKPFWGSWQAARGERTENPWLNKHCVFTFHCEELKPPSQHNCFHMFSDSSPGMTSCISETRQIRCWRCGKPCPSVIVCSLQILQCLPPAPAPATWRRMD